MDLAVAKLGSFEPRDKARLLWAFAQMARHGYPGQPALLRILRSLSAADVARLDPVSVSAVLWQCARLDEHPGPVLDAAAAYITANIASFSREQLLHAKAALTKHKVSDRGALEAIARHSASPLDY